MCILQSIGITGIINFFCYRSWWAWGLGIPIGIWYARWRKKELAERRRRILRNHFKEVLQGLQTAVRAGYSMEQGVTECRREMERLFGNGDDLVRELRYMESQMQVGVPVEQLFWNLGQRSGVEEIRNFGDIFLIARRSGGNLGKILGNLAEVLGEKIRVTGEIQVAKEVLQGLQTAVRAGYSMEQGVTECRREMERLFGNGDDLVRELRYMESQMQVGVPVEQLFWNLGQRSGVEEIRNFGDIFLIARRSGGNLGKILGNLAEVLGEKIRVTGEIQVAIAGKKLEQLVMSMVPGVMILYMQVTSRGFLDVLYHNLPGVLVMTGCLGVYLFSFRMGRKIVRIQV